MIQSIGQITVAEFILKQLEGWGVKRIYGVNGDGIFGLLDAIAKQSAIQFIAVKHESVAAMMASAEAKLTGNIAVCAATMGPGIGNLLNGLGDAYMDRAPVLAITGQAPTAKIGTDYKQFVNQQELIKPFATYTTLLTDANAIGEVMNKAFRISVNQGAVTHLSIPKDVFTMPTNNTTTLPAHLIVGKTDFHGKLSSVMELMNNAEHPMILAGVGARGAGAEIIKLAEKWGAGVLASLGGKGIFQDREAHYLGGIGQGGNPYAAELFKVADVILLAGNTWWPEKYVPKDTKIIQIDLAKENIGKGFDVNYGLIGKVEEAVPQLVYFLVNNDRSEWVERCNKIKLKWDKQNKEEGSSSGSPIPPARIMRAIENTVQEDAIISVDTGDVTVWFNRNFRANKQSMLFSGDWRTMGFGLPGAMAAKFNYPEKQVIAIVGDGGIEMVLADLLTAVRYELDITIIVLNNHALQMEKDKMTVENYEPNAVNLTNPDFTKLAEACGMVGLQVKSDGKLETTLEEAFSNKLPTLVSIETAPIIHPET